MELVGTGHPELIGREKLLRNWDCYYKCDLISVKFESEDRNHTNILNRENLIQIIIK